ncbi:MAG: hypothetical protein CVU54_16055 [Deltaproteobacteria bacterium HGW-Deltaproteobacteria-12]|jgi:hypothetical protein|nr:MAG: hypothetical protein CVU54_16055 [Deltaproteobacteria bacterium HGW-Deltaproteobacteria-12]
MNAKPNFEALYNINPWVKSFAFITSQDFENKLLMEYFLIIVDKNGKTEYAGKQIYYSQDALKLFDPQENYIEKGLEEAKSQVSIELMERYSKMFYTQENMSPWDPKWKLINDMPKFDKATISFLASHLPIDEKDVQNVFTTKNINLRDYLRKVVILKKATSSYDIPHCDN